VPRALDFALLIPSPPVGLPPALAFLEPVAARVRPPVWGRVECQLPGPVPGGKADRLSRGTMLMTGPAPAPPSVDGHRAIGRTLRRGARLAAAAVRRGSGLLALGGDLAGLEPLAAGLWKETGARTLTGLALEAAALLLSVPILLRWRGVDPDRARLAVVIDEENPGVGEAAVELLSAGPGFVGMWGPAGPRRSALVDRVGRTTGTALETFASVEQCLEAADLVVVTGAEEAAGGGRAAPTRDGTRPAVILDLRAGRGRGPVVSLAGPRGDAAVGERPGSPAGSWPFSGSGPVRVTAVFFEPPPGWSGRAEPGLETGLVSAPLAEAGACALSGRRVPAPRRQHTAGWMTAVYALALRCGFRPAAVALSLS